MRPFTFALAALSLAGLGHAAPPAPGGGQNLPVVTQLGDTLAGGTMTLEMQNTAYTPLELYLIGTQLLPAPVPLGSQGTLFFLWDLTLPGDPSQTSVYPIPSNVSLVGIDLLVQGLGLVIEGQVGELRLSDLVVVSIESPAPESLSYSENPATYLEGLPITANTPTVTWVPDDYSISPDLPSGLLLNSTTGVISGTPTEASPSTLYTVTATNGQGETTANLTIQVDPEAPTLFDYSVNPAVYTTIDEVTNTPIIDAAIDSYSVSPDLPAGLNLDPVTGVITGTPTVLSAATIYTVTASNVTGSIQTALTITVNPAPPADLEYDEPWIVYAAGVPIAPNTPTVTTEVVDSYSISPALPAGLNLNAFTGAITGTPAAISTPLQLTAYTVTATNVSGTDTATVEIVVDSLPPPVLTADPVSEPNGTINFSLAGTIDVGITEVLAIDILRNLPPVFSPGTGLIYLDTMSATYEEFDGDGSSTWTFSVPNDSALVGLTYYAQATGFVFFGVSGGVRISNVTETLISLPAPTNLTYPIAEATYVTDVPITSVTPTVTGFVQDWTINPALPAGLNFSTTDGTISGTPTIASPLTTYTVTASNIEGGTSADLDLRVIEGFIPQFAFAVSSGDSTLSAFGVDGDTGQLRQLSYTLTGPSPAAVAVTPDASFVYVANAFGASVTGYGFDSTNGQLEAVALAASGTLPTGLVIDETGTYLYATTSVSGDDGVYGYRIEANGALTPFLGGPVGVGTIPNDIARFGNIVATCSANSVDTVETYTIDAVTGVLTPVSSLAAGASPRGVEFSSDGQYLYVVNQTGNTISGYAVATDGTLTELAQSPFDMVIAGGDVPEDVATTKGGFLYTANLTGTLTGFSIALDGSLIPLGSNIVGSSVRAVSVDERGQQLVAVLDADNEIALFDIGGAGALSAADPVPAVRARGNPNAFAFASGLSELAFDSDRAYVVSQNENRVYEYTINDITGAIADFSTPDATLPQPGGVVIHPDQANVYVSALSFPGVGTYDVLGDGSLAGVPPGETTGQAPWSTAWEPSGRFAYTTLASPAGGVQILTRNGNGTVTAGAITGAGATTRRGTVDPTGRYYYAPNQGADTISQYLIDTATGTLIAQVPATVSTSAGPVAVAVDPSGRFVYSVAADGDVLNVFSIGITGALTTVTNVTLGGQAPSDLVVDPSGQYLYIAFEDSDLIEGYAISATTGIPIELGTSPFATDDQPVFITADAAGEFVYVVHRGTTDQVRAFGLNQATGQLTPGLPVATGGGAREMAINTKLSAD